MNTSLKWILVYGLYVFTKDAIKPAGTTFTNGKGSDEVTATVNGEATKNPEDYELIPLEPPAKNDKDKKKTKSLEQFSQEAKDGGLVLISHFALFGKPKELLKTPTPVFISAQKLLEDSLAPGNPQTVQPFPDKNEDSEEEKEEKKPETKEKEKEPDTKEDSNK